MHHQVYLSLCLDHENVDSIVPSHLQGVWVRVCSVPTKDMELLALSVLYLQGSDAGQKYIKI